MYTLTYAGMWYVFAFAIAQLSNSGFNFIIQKRWVFHDLSEKGTYRKIALFALSSFALYTIDAAMVFAAHEYLHIPYLLLPIVLVIPKTLLAYFFSSHIFQQSR